LKKTAFYVILFYQGENVYYALFGENVTEGLKNCLAYDTEIEPVYLKGDFGVFGSFERGKNDRVAIGRNFYIDKKRKSIDNLIRDGFPFFAGNIKLSKTVNVENTSARLVVDKPFHIIDVEINDTYVGRMMFNSSIDISKHLKKGENKISLTVTIGNRNLLGPFHTIEQDNGFVGPDTFERFGSWQDGKSRYYVEDYAFVEGII
jgi:hypothetical protein